MKIKVVYKSKKNNKKVATAMAKALGVTAQSMDAIDKKSAGSYEADLLFFGCAVLGGNVAPEVLTFFEQLDAAKVHNIVLFSANGFGKDQFTPLKENLRQQGFSVEEQVFSCLGSAFIFKNMGKPGNEELEAAKNFALKMKEIKK